jgi:hypothetical protein
LTHTKGRVALVIVRVGEKGEHPLMRIRARGETHGENESEKRFFHRTPPCDNIARTSSST